MYAKSEDVPLSAPLRSPGPSIRLQYHPWVAEGNPGILPLSNDQQSFFDALRSLGTHCKVFDNVVPGSLR